MRKIRLELTAAEAQALLTMCTSAEAGDLAELMERDGRRIAAAGRAIEKVRQANRSAEPHVWRVTPDTPTALTPGQMRHRPEIQPATRPTPKLG